MIFTTYPTNETFEKKLADIWVFPKIGEPQNGWFMMENLIKIGDLGVPLFSETPIYTCDSITIFQMKVKLG